MQGQAHRIEDWGAPRMTVGGLGDDLIKRYWKWRQQAHESITDNELKSPYFTKLNNNGQGEMPSGIPTGTSYGDNAETIQRVRTDAVMRGVPLVSDDGGVDQATGKEIGSWGIKQNYVQNTPAANFPPMNYKPYANLLVFDDLVKALVAGQEPSSTMIKKKMGDMDSKPEIGEAKTDEEENKFVPGLVAASAMLTAFSTFGEPQRAVARVDEIISQINILISTTP